MTSKISCSNCYTDEELVKSGIRIIHDKDNLTWRELASLLNINVGTLYGWVMRDRPLPNKYRHIFNLPEIQPVPVCPVCGIVHTRSCPKQYKRWRDMPDKVLKLAITNRVEVGDKK